MKNVKILFKKKKPKQNENKPNNAKQTTGNFRDFQQHPSFRRS